MLTANRAWYDSLNKVSTHGVNVGPRGMMTRELVNESIYWDMNKPIVTIPERKLNYQFMAAEAYWITCGSALVEEISPYCKHIDKYSDDGYIFNGAYGPMIDKQLMHCVNSLTRDPESRQAVMTIWHPNPSRSKDHKCTVALQFLIRNEKLHMIVTMRSNDLWLGRPYDMFNFTMIALKVACYIGVIRNHNGKDYPVVLGDAFLNVGSAHIYERDHDKAEEILYQLHRRTEGVEPLNYHFDWRENAQHLLGVRDETRDLREWG